MKKTKKITDKARKRNKRQQKKLDSPSSLSMHLSKILAIAALAIVINFNSFDVPFIFDDVYFTQNADLKDLSNLERIFTTWDIPRPVLALSFALNYHWGKLDTFGYHFINLFLHISIGIMVYFFISMTVKYFNPNKLNETRRADRIALWASLFFVSHPVQTESITYIWGRSGVLCFFFYLSTILLFIRMHYYNISDKSDGQKKNNTVLFYYIGSLSCFLLALGTKAIAISLPVVLIFYDYFFISDGKIKKLLPRLLRFHTLFFVISILRILGRYSSLGLSSLSNIVSNISGYIVRPAMAMTSQPVDLPLNKDIFTSIGYLFTTGLNGYTNILTQCRAIVEYLKILLFPHSLNVDHDFRISMHWGEPSVLIAVTVIIALLIMAVVLFKKSRLISFGIFWYFITLSFFVCLPLADTFVERRLYFPSMGFCIVMAVVINYVFHLLVNQYKNVRLWYWATGLCTIIVFIYSMTTINRNVVWQDKLTLWQDTIEKSPQKARGYNNIGLVYIKREKYHEAINAFQKATEIDPYHGMSQTNLITALYMAGVKKQDRILVDRSLLEFKKTLYRLPDHAASWFLEQHTYISAFIFNNIVFKVSEEMKGGQWVSGDVCIALGLIYYAVINDHTKALFYLEEGKRRGFRNYRYSSIHQIIRMIKKNIKT